MGLVKLGIVVADPYTLVTAGPLSATVLIGLLGLLVMIFCEIRKLKGGLVLGILVSTLIAAVFGKTETPDRLVSLDMNLSAISLRLDILGALKWSFAGSIFTLMFIDMFDSVGTLDACCHQADTVDTGSWSSETADETLCGSIPTSAATCCNSASERPTGRPLWRTSSSSTARFSMSRISFSLKDRKGSDSGSIVAPQDGW